MPLFSTHPPTQHHPAFVGCRHRGSASILGPWQGGDEPPFLSQEVPAWLHVRGSCAQNESCNVPSSDCHSLLYTLQGAPKFPLMDPTHEIESGGHRAEQEHESHQLEATSLGGTSTSHSNWKCCFPFSQIPQFHISSSKCCSHRADGLRVTQQLVNQMTMIKLKPSPTQPSSMSLLT